MKQSPPSGERSGSRVLVCDDEPAVRFAIAECLAMAGHLVTEADSGKAALERLASEPFDAVVSDLSMPGVDGMQVLAAAKAEGIPVVLVTARGSERAAVAAMRAGAFDYLAKPFDIDELGQSVARALEMRRLRQSDDRARVERAIGRPMIGDSPAMQGLFARVARLASRDVTVLVRGETGTGKEIVAQLLHGLGRRASGPFVRFNCAAIPLELAEAELFGHARGAFTGARDARQGYFARADGGTLVLDEVAELPAAIQPKLLRALQDGEIQPVGAGAPHKVDVRVVASTHRDLRAEVDAGRFREDLYYRLAVLEVFVPRLDERKADIPALARSFAARFADRFGVEDVRLSDDLCAALAAHAWPGNVRELENVVGGLVALSDGGVIGVDAWTERRRVPTQTAPDLAAQAPLRDQLDALERRLVGEALAAAGENKSEAARRLGLSRVTLLDRMKRLGF